MDNDSTKEQVHEIMELIKAGQPIDIAITSPDGRATLRADEGGVQRVSDTAVASTRTPTNVKTFNLRLESTISDSEIIERIRNASGLAQATATNGLPAVVVTRDEIRRVWILHETCKYVPANLHPPHTISALKGFEFDLASIPRIFWSIIASHELSLAAPLFHDLLYKRGGKLHQGELAPTGRVFVRSEVDDLFLELMTKANVPTWKRYTAYLAVRGFASFAWNDQSE